MAFDITEATGVLPIQVRLVIIILLAKPKGGFRSKVLFSSFYRLWCKARRPIAEEWERQHERRFFASGKGRGGVDAVWRQTARAELAVTDNKKNTENGITGQADRDNINNAAIATFNGESIR